ncbi:hypothetical protein [Anaerotignum sp.]
MEGFLTLAGQLFLILCIQSVLEAMVARWQNNFMLKPIELGCYLASLAAVLQFMEQYLFDTLRAISKFF